MAFLAVLAVLAILVALAVLSQLAVLDGLVRSGQGRVAPRSQNQIGADSKTTIFALFWPKNPSN